MAFYTFARNIPKGICFYSLKNRTTLLQNNINLTKIMSQKEFSSFNQLNKHRNVKQLLAQAILKTPQTLRKVSTEGDHRALWTAERALSVLLLGVIPCGIISPSAVTDNLIAVLTVAHVHWGLEAIVVDYIRPIIFGPVVPKVSLTILYVISAVTLGGLLYYNFTNIGIGKTIHKAWNPKKA